MQDDVLCIVDCAILGEVDDARCIHQKRGFTIVNILRLMCRVRLVLYDKQKVSDLCNIFRVAVSAATLLGSGLQSLLYVRYGTPVGIELDPNVFSFCATIKSVALSFLEDAMRCPLCHDKLGCARNSSNNRLKVNREIKPTREKICGERIERNDLAMLDARYVGLWHAKPSCNG